VDFENNYHRLWRMEEWRAVKDRVGMYEISSEGLVRSLVRKGCRKIRFLKLYKNWRGYWKVGLSESIWGAVRIDCFVHRLVAEAFITNPESKPQVNHIDGDKDNNRATNLEWVSNRENFDHAVAAGLRRYARGGDCGSALLSAVDVTNIRSMLLTRSCTSIAREVGVSRAAISDIKWGRTWKHLSL
jgi:hypothetical protein